MQIWSFKLFFDGLSSLLSSEFKCEDLSKARLSISCDGDVLSVLNEVVLLGPISHVASEIPCLIIHVMELLCVNYNTVFHVTESHVYSWDKHALV